MREASNINANCAVSFVDRPVVHGVNGWFLKAKCSNRGGLLAVTACNAHRLSGILE